MSSMEKNLITKIVAEQIKDSRHNPAIKVNVFVGDITNSFSVPSGASTGAHEAHELRDEDGIGVKKAIAKVNDVIAPALIGKSVFNQIEIDKIMLDLDGTSNKDNLGGNAMIGVSIACAKTAALVADKEVFEYLRTLAEIKSSRGIPNLYMNLVNGGKHAENNLAFQEYHIVTSGDTVLEMVENGVKIQNTLNEIILRELGIDSIVLGDEGGFAPRINDIKKPLVYLSEAIKQNKLEDKVRLALDVAASSFYKKSDRNLSIMSDTGLGIYKIDETELSKEQLMAIYDSLIKEFNLLSIEDPFDEEDFEDFRKIKDAHKDFFAIGDDLTVTNKILLQKAIDSGSINAMIIKPNQIGTLTETLETMKLARDNNIELIVSHRSGETNDDFISDLTYAFGCFALKAGAPLKAERRLKYDRLIKISTK